MAVVFREFFDFTFRSGLKVKACKDIITRSGTGSYDFVGATPASGDLTALEFPTGSFINIIGRRFVNSTANNIHFTTAAGVKICADLQFAASQGVEALIMPVFTKASNGIRLVNSAATTEFELWYCATSEVITVC